MIIKDQHTKELLQNGFRFYIGTHNPYQECHQQEHNPLQSLQSPNRPKHLKLAIRDLNWAVIRYQIQIDRTSHSGSDEEIAFDVKIVEIGDDWSAQFVLPGYCCQ